MNKRDYERKQAKIRRQKRFINTERAASRKTIRKTARQHKSFVKDDFEDYTDAPDGIQFRE